MVKNHEDIFKDADTGFVVVAALRYCYGRRSYAPWLVTDWVLKHWQSIPERDRSIIRRDTREYFESPRDKGDECDRKTWELFLKKITEEVSK